MNNKKIRPTDIALLALSLCLALGVALVFKPCAAHEDGGWMTCHWAGQAVLGIGIALCVLAVARLFLDGKARQGLDLAFIAFAGLAALLPGSLINLCMMANMRCRAVMRPAVIVVSALIVVAALIDIPLQREHK